MPSARHSSPTRRAILGGMAASAVPALANDATAQQPRLAAPPVNFVGWTATTATNAALRQQISDFMQATGIGVSFQQFPWGTYRGAVLARLMNNGPADVIWLSDAWLPEFAEAGWVGPIGDIPALSRFAPETRMVCTEAMSHRGQQYGMPYYTDNMAFLYNEDMLRRAGFNEPPTNWLEVVRQSQILQRRGIAEAPLGLALADDTWLIEMISTLVFSFGGHFIDVGGRPVMAENSGTRAALEFLRHSLRHERITATTALETTEMDLLEGFGQGRHAFAILPTYRLRYLNNPALFPQAGNFTVALMPNGGDALHHETCGWVRMFAMTSAAAAQEPRRTQAIRFLEAFGGRDHTGQYSMARRLLFEGGLPFCATPLYRDPAVIDYTTEWSRGRNMVLRNQMDTVRNKDTIAPWFANWQAVTDPLWHAICLDTLPVDAALQLAAEAWLRLQRARN